MSELRPCPFCGGEAIGAAFERQYSDGTTADWLYGVSCRNCDMDCGWYETEYEAQTAWNRRADEKLGKWAEDVDGAYICSACGCYDYEASKYCPNCGAKMEAENDGK